CALRLAAPSPGRRLSGVGTTGSVPLTSCASLSLVRLSGCRCRVACPWAKPSAGTVTIDSLTRGLLSISWTFDRVGCCALARGGRRARFEASRLSYVLLTWVMFVAFVMVMLR